MTTLATICRQIRQQYVYGNINQLESLMEANLQIYTPNTRFWWRMQVLECASMLPYIPYLACHGPPRHFHCSRQRTYVNHYPGSLAH